MRKVLMAAVAAIILPLAACGDTKTERGLSGGGIGAGVGAAGAALTGGSVLGGALIGGAVGAATGIFTDEDDISLD